MEQIASFLGYKNIHVGNKFILLVNKNYKDKIVVHNYVSNWKL